VGFLLREIEDLEPLANPWGPFETIGWRADNLMYSEGDNPSRELLNDIAYYAWSVFETCNYRTPAHRNGYLPGLGPQKESTYRYSLALSVYLA
jgi:hypothetical protein